MEDEWESTIGDGFGLERDHGGRDAAGGELNAEIARLVVGIYRHVCGRGPTRARTMFRSNVVVVVLEDLLTPAERSLIADGRVDAALEMRRSLHAAMGPALGTAIAEATGCPVLAVMSDSNDDPDVTVEVFLLGRPVDPSRVAPAP
ncbi:MAG TPA: Na-translocating system protein MpsC family protein [Thermoleophilaceae bacterium]|nr:Na-translocating system protein MpsC family protein [Thermoleophilaceae bacterium]